MAAVVLKSLAALGVAAGLALASVDSAADQQAYGEQTLDVLTQFDVADNALREFMRADLNNDNVLDKSEYVTLNVVTAELAFLNGFVSFDRGDAAQIVKLPVEAPGALAKGEHVRIVAVATRDFYRFAGKDARMSANEFVINRTEAFDAADLNSNGRLRRAELSMFVQRQVHLSTGV